MSVPPDPVELTAPRDPADYGRPRLMTRGFWAFMAFGLLCVIAGAVLAIFGPTLFRAKPHAPAEVPAPRYDAPARPSGEPAAEASPSPPPTPAPEAVARLSDRIDQLETAQNRTAESAASALAAAALMDAAQTSRPFPDELAALAAVSPPSAELRALKHLAETGAPSRAALAAEFPDYAARAAGAAHVRGDADSLLARIEAALARVVVVRRVGEVNGAGVDALLARAERQVQDGDIDRALRTLDGLSPAGREALAPWRVRAEQRAEIDRRVSGLRAQALEDLARLARRGA
jgi:hypothetical protein